MVIAYYEQGHSKRSTADKFEIEPKARSLAKKQVYLRVYPDIKEAKFSQKWVDGFMSRHNLVNRRKTTIAQRLPDDYVEKQNQFLSYVLFRRREHNYPLSLIANMDEMPMAFNLTSNTTVEHR